MEKIDFTSKYVSNARSAPSGRSSSSSKTDLGKVSTGWNDAVSRQDNSRQKKSKKEGENEGQGKKAPAPLTLFSAKQVMPVDEEEFFSFDDSGEEEVGVLDLSMAPKKDKKAHHHEDHSFVTALAGPAHFAMNDNIGASVTTGVRGTTALDELYRGLVEHIQEMKQAGKTELTIELKNLPLFEGVTLVVTEYGTARGEYNLAFYGLKTEAQQLLVNPLQQDQLRMSMEQKGYAVHIIVATMEPIRVDQSLSGRPSGEREQQSQSREGSEREEPRQKKR